VVVCQELAIESGCPEGRARRDDETGTRNHGNPEEEAAVWLDRLVEADSRRASFQDMAAAGLITFDELGAKLNALEEAGKTARRELAAIEVGKSVCKPSSVTGQHCQRVTLA
jgi:hypothetical protein